MKIVKFLHTQPDSTQKLIATIQNEDGKSNKVVYESDDFDIFDFLIEEEYIIGKGAKKISIRKQPIEFLENLQFAFSGTRLRCSEVIES